MGLEAIKSKQSHDPHVSASDSASAGRISLFESRVTFKAYVLFNDRCSSSHREGRQRNGPRHNPYPARFEIAVELFTAKCMSPLSSIEGGVWPDFVHREYAGIGHLRTRGVGQYASRRQIEILQICLRHYAVGDAEISSMENSNQPY